jgi:hypothetical protein
MNRREVARSIPHNQLIAIENQTDSSRGQTLNSTAIQKRGASHARH